MSSGDAGWDETDRLTLSNLSLSGVALVLVAGLGFLTPHIMPFAAGAAAVIVVAASFTAWGWLRDRHGRGVENCFRR